MLSPGLNPFQRWPSYIFPSSLFHPDPLRIITKDGILKLPKCPGYLDKIKSSHLPHFPAPLLISRASISTQQYIPIWVGPPLLPAKWTTPESSRMSQKSRHVSAKEASAKAQEAGFYF